MMIHTLVIGAGQAGLAMSHMLSKRGLPHLVVERHRIAERWRSERWDGLHFQSPSWSIGLPDFAFADSDPDRFPRGQEICDFITAYADFIRAPVRCGVEVKALRPRSRINDSIDPFHNRHGPACPGHDGGGGPLPGAPIHARRLGQRAPGFVAETTDGPIEAANVVVATGPYQRPLIPALLPNDAGVVQIHASGYRNPDQLPGGAVLVVGSGNSGAQIAEELMRAGRQVYLSVGRHRRAPRPYRGRDLIWWWRTLGIDRTPADRRGADRSVGLTSGALGGYTIDLRAFAARGMILVGRAQAFRDGVMHFAPDLAANIAHGDAAYLAFVDQADAYVRQAGLDLPREPEARVMLPDPPCLTEPLPSLHLRAAGIGSVVWATGYRYDLGWIDTPAVDANGTPVHNQGVTDVSGLYFLGLHFLSRMNSALLSGVGEDAARLADHILARSGE